MAERDRAAVDVDLVLVDAEHPHRVERDRGEGLVDLPEVDVLGRLADLLQRLLGRVARASSPGRGSRRRRCRRRARVASGSLPFACAHSSEATTTAAAPSLTPGALPAVWVASSPPIAFSLASVSTRRVGADRLVGLDHGLGLARLDRDADDLLGQAALVGRLGGELVRALGEAVHVGAGDLELVGDLARLVDHLLVGERVGEAVVGHRVDRLDVAHPEAEAGAGQQVGAPGSSTPCRR